MDADAAGEVVQAVGVGALLRAGAGSAAPAALLTLQEGAVAYITALSAAAKRFSEGSNRDGGNIRDVYAALEHVGSTSIELRSYLRRSETGETLALEEVPPPAPVTPFVSQFAAPVKQPAHMDRKRFGPLPPPHQWKDDPPPAEEPADYVETRMALGREYEDMQTAMANLHLRRRGGIQVEGFPHLQVLKHTVSPPYLAHFT